MVSTAPDINPTVIRIRNIGRRVGKKAVWIDSLDIPRGRVVAIMGVSGAGKSTLLHVLGGIARPDFQQGTNYVGALSQKPMLEVIFSNRGEQLVYDLCNGSNPTFQERISFVFQSPYLLQSATASANIALGAYAARRVISRQAMGQITDELDLDRSFLANRSSARSGGERQRIALGRAFARSPNLILADEPTANLDPRLAEEIIRLLVRWSSLTADRTTIWVTHDVQLAAKFADDIVMLSNSRLAEKSAWPRDNPRDPEIIRRWIDGNIAALPSVAQCAPLKCQTREKASCESNQAGYAALPVGPASKWERLRFWTKLGIAQVFDGVGADRVGLLRQWTSIALPARAVRAANWKERLVQFYLLFATFSSKAAVFRLALFLMLMTALWVELDGLTRNIREALLAPTMNPVIISSRNTIDDSAINAAKESLAIDRGNSMEVPDAFGRYEFAQRRVSVLREEAASALPPESCANPESRIDREILMDIAAIDPGEPMLGRVTVVVAPDLPKDRAGISDRFDGFWSVWISRAAEEKLSEVLGMNPETKHICLEVRGIWLTAEITGIMQATARGRLGAYDVIISGTQWRDFGPAADRDYYQTAAVYFDAEPTRSRELVETVRLRAAKIVDPPNTLLVQSLANEAAFERISAALERNVLMQIIVGVLGSLSVVVLVLVIYAYVSDSFRNNIKPICVAVALGAAFPEVAIVQTTRILFVAAPAAILSAVAMTCLSLWGWSSATHLFWEFWAGIPVVVAGSVLLTLGISAGWLAYLKRRSLADQLKELE